MSEAAEERTDTKAKRALEDAAGIKLFATVAANYSVAHGDRAQPAPVKVCRTRSVSLDRVVVEAPESLAVGVPVHLNIAGLGVCSGRVSRTLDNGFVVDIDVSREAVERLAPKLRWLKRFYARDAHETRKHGRHLVPARVVGVVREDGPPLAATLYDISSSGMAVRCPDHAPALGARVTVDALAGTVVRHFEGGFAIQFGQPQTIEALRAALFPKR